VDFRLLGLAADDLKDRFAEFVTQMGQADQVGKPLKQSWAASGGTAAEEYQRSWVQIVNGAVELSQTIDKLSRAVADAKSRAAG